MSLVDDVRGEIKTAKKLRLPWWGVLCVVIGSYLCAELFDKFGKLDLVVPILNTIVVLGFMLALKRKLWRYAWFWVTMLVIALLHVPLILFVPWGSGLGSRVSDSRHGFGGLLLDIVDHLSRGEVHEGIGSRPGIALPMTYELNERAVLRGGLAASGETLPTASAEG